MPGSRACGRSCSSMPCPSCFACPCCSSDGVRWCAAAYGVASVRANAEGQADVATTLLSYSQALANFGKQTMLDGGTIEEEADRVALSYFDEVLAQLERAVTNRTQSLALSSNQGTENVEADAELVGQSAAMQQVYKLIGQVAATARTWRQVTSRDPSRRGSVSTDEQLGACPGAALDRSRRRVGGGGRGGGRCPRAGLRTDADWARQPRVAAPQRPAHDPRRGGATPPPRRAAGCLRPGRRPPLGRRHAARTRPLVEATVPAIAHVPTRSRNAFVTSSAMSACCPKAS